LVSAEEETWSSEGRQGLDVLGPWTDGRTDGDGVPIAYAPGPSDPSMSHGHDMDGALPPHSSTLSGVPRGEGAREPRLPKPVTQIFNVLKTFENDFPPIYTTIIVIY